MSFPLDIIPAMDEHAAQLKAAEAERVAAEKRIAAEQLRRIRRWQAGMDPDDPAEKPLPTEEPLPPLPLPGGAKAKEPSTPKKVATKVKRLLSPRKKKPSVACKESWTGEKGSEGSLRMYSLGKLSFEKEEKKEVDDDGEEITALPMMPKGGSPTLAAPI